MLKTYFCKKINKIMNKNVIFLILLFCYGSFAQASTNNFSIKFDIDSVDIEEINISGNTYSYLTYRGLFYNSQKDCPMVPVKYVNISVPYNATDIKLSDIKYVYEADIKLPNKILYNSDAQTFEMLEDGFLFPENNINIIGEGFYKGHHKIITLAIYPIQYDCKNELCKFSSEINYSLSYTLNSEQQNYKIQPLYSIYEDGVENVDVLNPQDVYINANPETLIRPLTLDSDEYKYVIVTHAAYNKAAQRLAAFRRLKGYSTRICFIESILSNHRYEDGDKISGIKDDAGKLRAFLRELYNANGTRYVLLAGDDLPFRYVTANFFAQNSLYIPSDFYFSELNNIWDNVVEDKYKLNKNSKDFYCEIGVGRLPVKDEKEFEEYIDKIKIYEFNPGLGDKAYLGKSLLLFQNELKEDGVFDENSFIYYKSSFANTKGKELVKYNEVINPTPSGREIIEYLKSNNFGCLNLVGHGSPMGIATTTSNEGVYSILALEGQNLYNISETGNGINLMNNYPYFSWCYSPACATMPYDQWLNYNTFKNWGESYVTGTNYGGVAFVGNTREGSPHEGKATMFYFFRSIYNDLWKSDMTDCKYASDYLNLAKPYLASYPQEVMIQNLLGDPVTNLWCFEPTKLSFIEKYNHNEDKLQYSISCLYDTNRKCIMSTNSLSDYTYVTTSIAKKQITDTIAFKPNTIYSLFHRESLPLILPLKLQDFRFKADNYYIVTGDVTIFSCANPYMPNGSVVIPSEADVTIEAMGNVNILGDLHIENGGKLTIKSDSIVSISNFTLPEGAELYVDCFDFEIGNNVDLQPGSIFYFKRSDKSKSYCKYKKNEEYSPLVVEGRTWWYGSYQYCDKKYAGEIALRIGEEEEIDGEMWHKIECVKLAEFKIETEAWEIKEANTKICNIREENKKIYVKLNLEDVWSWPIGMSQIIIGQIFNQFADNTEDAMVYDFEVEVGDHISYGSEWLSFDYMITNVEKTYNSGYEYNMYFARHTPESILDNESSYVFIDKIGHERNVFFLPVQGMIPTLGGWEIPRLRYVTGSDGELIFEGDGGFKLWEMDSGLNQVFVDDIPRWYNLQGLEIARPNGRGVYIRQNGEKAEKIILR